MIENGKILVPYLEAWRPIEAGTLDLPKGLSYSDTLSTFSGAIIKKKRSKAADKSLSLYQKFSFGSWKISLKRGRVTLSCEITASAVPTSVRYPDQTAITHWAFERAVSWRFEPEDTDFQPYWRVIGDVTVRSRQKSGGHKIVGSASTRPELAELIEAAEKAASWSPGTPEFIPFADDGIEIGAAPKRRLPPIVKSGSRSPLIRAAVRSHGFHTASMLGFVHITEDLEVINVTGGNKKPHFLLYGVVNAPGGATSQSVVVNNDASGYLMTRVIQNKVFITNKVDERSGFKPLTHSDQALIKLAISDYISTL